TVSTVGSPNNTITVNGNMTRLIANSAGNIIIAGGPIGTLNLTANDTSATSITQTAAMTANNTLTINSMGNVTLNNLSNNLSNVSLWNVVGDAVVYSSKNMTLSGNTTGNVTALAGTSTGGGSFQNPWNVVLGNLITKSLTVGAFNAGTTVGALA